MYVCVGLLYTEILYETFWFFSPFLTNRFSCSPQLRNPSPYQFRYPDHQFSFQVHRFPILCPPMTVMGADTAAEVGADTAAEVGADTAAAEVVADTAAEARVTAATVPADSLTVRFIFKENWMLGILWGSYPSIG